MMESVKKIACSNVTLSSFEDDSDEEYYVSVNALGLGGFDLTVSRLPNETNAGYSQVVTTHAMAYRTLKRLASGDFKRVFQRELAEAIEDLVTALESELA